MEVKTGVRPGGTPPQADSVKGIDTGLSLSWLDSDSSLSFHNNVFNYRASAIVVRRIV